METQTFLFYGQVGSGKGTQIKLLMDYLKSKTGKDCLCAGPGVEFRKLIETKNFTSSLVTDSILRGELQPDFLTTSLFTNVLVSNLTPEKHFFADGYPRTIAQSESFETMMEFFKRENIKIIYIELSKEEAMKRNLLRGRADDTEEGLNRRFDAYFNNVVPSMNYFREKEGYEIYTINGEQGVEEVQKEIISALNLE
jgi:adenylate kinase family enzyme